MADGNVDGNERPNTKNYAAAPESYNDRDLFSDVTIYRVGDIVRVLPFQGMERPGPAVIGRR